MAWGTGRCMSRRGLATQLKSPLPSHRKAIRAYAHTPHRHKRRDSRHEKIKSLCGFRLKNLGAASLAPPDLAPLLNPSTERTPDHHPTCHSPSTTPPLPNRQHASWLQAASRRHHAHLGCPSIRHRSPPSSRHHRAAAPTCRRSLCRPPCPRGAAASAARPAHVVPHHPPP